MGFLFDSPGGFRNLRLARVVCWWISTFSRTQKGPCIQSWRKISWNLGRAIESDLVGLVRRQLVIQHNRTLLRISGKWGNLWKYMELMNYMSIYVRWWILQRLRLSQFSDVSLQLGWMVSEWPDSHEMRLVSVMFFCKVVFAGRQLCNRFTCKTRSGWFIKRDTVGFHICDVSSLWTVTLQT